MSTFITYSMLSFIILLTMLFIITSDISVVSYIRITFKRINWHHFLQAAKEINIENTFEGFGNKILEGIQVIGL